MDKTLTPPPPSSDPLHHSALRGPGLRESLCELFLNKPRMLDCMQVEVTSVCAGRCTYCPHTTQAEHWISRHMEAQTFAALWPLMRQSGRVHLQGWGEPFLHPRFMDFARTAIRAGCRVSTTTCGLYMSENLAEALVASGIDVIAFSLTGTDSASNAARAGVPFDRVCDAIRQLQKVRRNRHGVHLELHFAYLLLASNMSSVRELPELMEELGIHAAVVSTLDYIAAPGMERDAFAPHETEKIAAARELLQQTQKKAEAKDLAFHYALPSPRPSIHCRENIQRTLYANAAGDLSPCVYVNIPTDLPDPSRRIFGNGTQTDPLEIWNAPEFRAFREALQSAAPDTPCRACAKRFESSE